MGWSNLESTTHPLPDNVPCAGPEYEAEREKLLRELAGSLERDRVVFEQNDIAYDGVKKHWVKLDPCRDAYSIYRDFPRESSGADVPLAGKKYEQYRAQHFAQMADVYRRRDRRS